MYFEEKNGVKILKFDILKHESGVLCGVSTRRRPDGGEMDLGVAARGAAGAPFSNLSLFCSALDINSVAFMRQRHTANVAFASAGGEYFENTDCLVTDRPGLGLLTVAADCGMVCFYDSRHGALAVMHGGWRGTMLNVYGAALAVMRLRFGTGPDDVIACAAPMISAANYEVKEDFVASLRSFRPGDYRSFLSSAAGKTFFDLRSMISARLSELGITRTEFSGFCTCGEPELFPSWRRDGAATRHFGMLAALKK